MLWHILDILKIDWGFNFSNLAIGSPGKKNLKDKNTPHSVNLFPLSWLISFLCCLTGAACFTALENGEHPSIVGFSWSHSQSQGSAWAFLSSTPSCSPLEPQPIRTMQSELNSDSGRFHSKPSTFASYLRWGQSNLSHKNKSRSILFARVLHDTVHPGHFEWEPTV